MIADLGLMRLIFPWEQTVYLQLGPLRGFPLPVAVAASTTPSAETHCHLVFSPHLLPPTFAQSLVTRTQWKTKMRCGPLRQEKSSLAIVKPVCAELKSATCLHF